MSRFTLIKVNNNFPEAPLTGFDFYLPNNKYTHLKEIDFESKEAVKGAIPSEELPPGVTWVIVEYETLATAQWKINGLTPIWPEMVACPEIESQTYETSLIVDIDQNGKMCGNLLPSVISERFSEWVEQYTVDYINEHPDEEIKKALVEKIVLSEEADRLLIPESILKEIKERVEVAFKKEYKVYQDFLKAQAQKEKDDKEYKYKGYKDYMKDDDLDKLILDGYKNSQLTLNNYNKINLLIACEQPVKALREHIKQLSDNLQTPEVSTTLNLMLDGFVAGIRYKFEDIDKNFYTNFKKDFMQHLNKSELFSSPKLETLHYKILTALNKLIDILSGRKIAAISSKTKFFEKKKDSLNNFKQDFEKEIDTLQTMHNL